MDYLFLLYLGDIIGNVAGTAILMSLLWGIGNLIWYALQADNAYSADWKTECIPARKKVFKAFVISTVALAISALLPSKSFIYTAVALKAGVEITQEIKDNPLVSKGFKVLEKYLDEELGTSTTDTSADANTSADADQG